MSLTSFLKNKDVEDAFKQEFKKPQLKLQGELLAPPLTNHYGLVGTAFDYLLRFYIKQLNPNAIEKDWVSERSLYLLEKQEYVIDKKEIVSEPSLHYKKVKEIIQHSREAYDKFIKTRKMSSDLYKAVLLLAQVDVIYRAGLIDENLGSVDKQDIEDIKNLISIAKPEYFKAKKICILNPTFGKTSQLVGGADCDLVIDDSIVEIKTTKKLEVTRDHFDQLIGYYILYKIGGIDDMPSNHKIKRLGIYFSRYAYFLFIDVRDIIKENTFPNFVEWFKKRAGEEYGYHI